MAVAMWIRNNMLNTSNQIERQLTEAELKVQRSLQKLSIPDWYLNKRSAPPKILTNVAPIESRPSPWKSINTKKMLDGDPRFFARYPSGTYRISGRGEKSSESPKLNSDTFKIPNKNETISHDEKNTINDKTFEVRVRQKYISKTFPKVSPSRKIQNINIVFPPPAKKLELSIDEKKKPEKSLNEAMYVSDRETEYSTETESEGRKACCESEDEEPYEKYKSPTKKSSELKSPGDSFSSVDYRTPMKTPDPRHKFKVRAVSTPQGTPASLYSSAMVEEATNPKGRVPLWYTRTRNVFEVAGSSSRDTQVPRKPQLPDLPVVQDAGPKAASSPRKPARRSSLDPVSSATERFFSSRNKSTELENIVKSSEEARAGKRHVREIIQTLSEKCEANTSISSTATSVQSYSRSSQSYVKKLVRALENGQKREAQEIIEERRKAEERQEYEESEGSDTDVKSAACSTSISISDTESGSESDQRSPSLASSKDRFRYDDVHLARKSKEDEHVHWIPIPRCKMPRTSSLLSMMSRLSTNSGQQSPCVSPIKCHNDCPPSLQAAAWGSTYKKTSTPYNQLFRIDETVITDSGYSEKSDRSSSAGSADADVSWSTQTTRYRSLPNGVSRKIVY